MQAREGRSGIIAFTNLCLAVLHCLNTDYLPKIIFMVLLPPAKSANIIIWIYDTSKRNEWVNQINLRRIDAAEGK